MPGREPAGDFVESLERLFEELDGGGFDSVDDVQGVASQITWLLVTCTSMTSARARASCPVVFPDGRAPKSAMALPPSGLNLDRDTLARLCDAETGDGGRVCRDPARGDAAALSPRMEQGETTAGPRREARTEGVGSGVGGKRRGRSWLRGTSSSQEDRNRDGPAADEVRFAQGPAGSADECRTSETEPGEAALRG